LLLRTASTEHRLATREAAGNTQLMVQELLVEGFAVELDLLPSLLVLRCA
jgi:hypothetical protein